MSNFNTLRKANALAKMTVLIFLAIAFQSLIIIPQVWNFVNQNQVSLFPISFDVLYLTFSFAFVFLASLYVTPKMVISPYYAQLGTIGIVIIFLIINYPIFANKLSLLTGLIIGLFVQLSLFGFLGLFEAMFMRKVIGMHGELDDIWTEAYKIEKGLNSVKELLINEFNKDYDVEELEKELVLVRKGLFYGVKILINAKVDPNNSANTLLSISCSEIKLESMWKTDKANDRLKRIKYFIDGKLREIHSVNLILDKEQKMFENTSQLKLINAIESSLSKIGKEQLHDIYKIGGLLALGGILTALVLIPSPLKVPPEYATEVLAGMWVTIITAILYSGRSEIKQSFVKKAK